MERVIVLKLSVFGSQTLPCEETLNNVKVYRVRGGIFETLRKRYGTSGKEQNNLSGVINGKKR